jgi:hypothetical protein
MLPPDAASSLPASSFFMDIIIPLVGFVLLALQHRDGRLATRLI